LASFFHSRIVQPVKRLFTQGNTPQKIALTMELGVVLSVFPVMGSTSLLCAAAALALKLNLPAIQAVNYVMYPVQLLLIVPLIKLGEFMLRTNQTSLTLSQMLGQLKFGFWHAVQALWILAVQGIAAWLAIAPFAFVVLYWIFLSIAHRVHPDGSHRQAKAVA
jgi:uncharacterized protein (DUF2062 family)